MTINSPWGDSSHNIYVYQIITLYTLNILQFISYTSIKLKIKDNIDCRNNNETTILKLRNLWNPSSFIFHTNVPLSVFPPSIECQIVEDAFMVC